MLCYDSVWSMFDCRRYILPTLPLSISEKEKLGEPKEEIGNLKMDLNICILMIYKYNICKLNICILVILRHNISNLNILRIHISYFHGHNNTLVHCLSSHCQTFWDAYPFLHETWVFYDVLHYASPHHSCSLPWSARLPPTLLWCFHKLELRRQHLIQSFYQEKFCSYSIYSIAESNDHLQHD